ncbi:MAG: DUF1559 family PulG-like putative transporter [Thermoguttaceae bacterium]
MAESRPNSEPEINSPPPIDPDVAAAAIQELNDAMAILPKKRLGCLGRFARYGAVLLVLLAAFVYWNFFRTPPLRISKETTYITEPLTSDGKRVDYFAAMEKLLYPPEMKTDDNGYRLIVRELGDAEDERYDFRGNKIEAETNARSEEVYRKLGLDPATRPTMTYVETYEFFQKSCPDDGLDEKQRLDRDAQVYEPWTLDDLPMLKPWLEKNGPVLDLVGIAVRKPVFFLPIIRGSTGGTLGESLSFGEMQRSRSFARMLSARAHYRIGTGDIDGAIDDVITCARLGRHLERQGTVIARLVGIAIEGVAASIGIAAQCESQPREEQLQRLVDQLNSLPPRPSMDQTLLTERYYTLDILQSLAHGNSSAAEALALGFGINLKPGIASYVSIDWNIVMQRVNVLMDDWDSQQVSPLPSLWSTRNLFIGARSRRVADRIALTFHVAVEADHRLSCGDNLWRIAIAMLLYQSRHGTLPPAYTTDADDKPLHSWRVLLLPYLGQEELYGKLRLDEPWDSQHNRRFHDAAMAVYQCPSARVSPGQTSYSVVVGEKTAFHAAEGKSLENLGMNLMLVVERRQPVCWMDPTSELGEAIAVEGINSQEKSVDGIGSRHPGGIDAGLRDGSVRFIPETIDSPTLQGLLGGTAEAYP